MRSSKTLPGNRGQRIQALFEAARGLSPAQQASFLDQACAGDIEIRREIDAILAAARGPTDQRLRKLMDVDMDRTVVDKHTVVARRAQDARAADHAATLLPDAGTRIGQYELVRELGRGGMAVVYLARDVKLGRRVAIKFLQANEGSLARRFVLEAQATARCVHENIVVFHADPEKRSNSARLLIAFSSLCPSCAHVRLLAALPRRASAGGSPCPPARAGRGRSASTSETTCGA